TLRSAEVGAPDQRGPIWRPFAQPDIGASAVERGIEDTYGAWVTHIENDAAAVEVPVGIVGGGEAEIIAGASAETGEGKFRIDDDLFLPIVIGQSEGEDLSFQCIFTPQIRSDPIALAEGNRCFFDQRTYRGDHVQFTVLQHDPVLPFVTEG